MTNTKTFKGDFLIWRKVGDSLKKGAPKKSRGNPTFRHKTFEEAETEANRLLSLFPDSIFIILQEVGCVKIRDEISSEVVDDPESS